MSTIPNNIGFYRLNKLKLNKLINNGILTTIVEIFSLVTARKFLNIDRNDFHGMIVCPKSHSTYSCEDCFELEMFTTYFQVILREAIHPWSGRSVSKSRFLRAHVHLFEQQSFSSALPSPALSLPHSPALLFTSPPATLVQCSHMPRLLSLFKSRPVSPSSWTMSLLLHQQPLEIPFLSTHTQNTHTHTHIHIQNKKYA